MFIMWILSISVSFQFLSAFLALRLMRITKKSTAWAFITFAIFLMGFRRSITLFRLITGDTIYPPDLTAELVALIISSFMVIGLAFITPLFKIPKDTKKISYDKKFLITTIIIFVLLLTLVWLNEILDLPRILLGAAHHPLNWRESIIETLLILVVAVWAVSKSSQFLKNLKQNQIKIEHLNNVLRAVRNVNQLITKEKNPKKLINSACEMLVETRGYSKIFISIFDEKGKIKSTTYKNIFIPKKKLKNIKMINCEKIILEKNDIDIIKNSNEICKNCSMISKSREDTCLCKCLRHEKKNYGIITISVPCDITIDEEEISLFNELANDISYALYNIDIEKNSKHAEKIIHLKDELIRMTGEIAKVGGWEFDTDTLKGTWTDVVAEIHDLDPSQETNAVLGLSFYSGESREKIEKAVKEAIELAKPYDLELKMTSAKGIHKWVRTIGLPFIENGKVVKIRGIFQDITEQKKAEEEIKSLAKFPSENPNPVLRISREGILLYANNAAFSLLSDWNLKAGHEVPEILKKLTKESFAKHIIQTIDVPYGRIIYSIAVSCSRDMEYVNMYASDITERKLTEEKIKKLNKELEHKVIERTAELIETNKELESFSYSVSHDLKSPIRHINGFSHVLLENYSNKLDNEGKDILNRIQNSTQFMTRLIEDLLALSKASRYEIKYQKIDLTKMTASIINEIKKDNPERKIDIIINKVPEIKSDINMLNIAMTNLIGNAWKFTEKQPDPKIEFGFSKNKDEIIYFIKDNGAGFDMAYADKLFGAFQRLHSSKEFPGTGIGLAIVKRIFNRLGGHIWAEAEVDKGAVFYFVLPKGENK